MVGIMELRASVVDFFATIDTIAENRIFTSALPLVGDDIAGSVTTALAFLDDLEADILAGIDAVGMVDEADVAELVAAQLDMIDGIDASADMDGNLLFSSSDTGMVDLGTLMLDAGLDLPGAGFDFSGDFAMELEWGYNFGFSFNTTDGFAFDDQGADELTLGLAGALDVEASANLGFLEVEVSDNLTDPEDRELELDFAFDIPGDGTPPELTVDGAARFNTRVDTMLLSTILPSFGADLVFEYSFADFDLLDVPDPFNVGPSIALENITVDLGDIAEFFNETFGSLFDVIDTFPLGNIVDLLIERIPVISEIAPFLDEDGVNGVTLRDLVVLYSGLTGDTSLDFIDSVIEVLEIIDIIGDIIQAGEEGALELGSISLTETAGDDLAAGDPVNLGNLFDAGSIVEPLEGVLSQLTSFFGSGFTDFLDGFGAGLAGTASATAASSGFSLPFLEQDPLQTAASLLLNGLGTDPITIVQYDLEPLRFETSASVPFQFGPFLLKIGGEFFAETDFLIGYDTAGFSGDGFDFLEGFFIGTAPVEASPGSMTAPGFEPFATTGLGLIAFGGVGVVLLEVGVEGGLRGVIDIYLAGSDDGKTRLSELSFPCIFEMISGKVTAGLKLVITLGWGPFSITKKLGLAEVTLAQFNFDPCDGPHGEDVPEVFDSGLASEIGGGVLRLNVGGDADLRELSGSVDVDALGNDPAEQEVFFVGLPPSDDGDPIPPGVVAVNAFGVFERYGEENPITLIVAEGGSEDDDLQILASLAIPVSFAGGGGNDILIGGAAGDALEGGAGIDDLRGNDGDDILLGGDDSDFLDGGRGADFIDGGEGTDQVDYSSSSEGVRFESIVGSEGRIFVGEGGEAEGDILVSVEYIVGSNFDDTLLGNPDESNILDGNPGDDILIGGSQDDLILGGAGADFMDGQGGSNDRTSYVFSDGGIFLDLLTNFNTGGHAQGDTLISIEHIQGSYYGDFIFGNGLDNEIDGTAGEDLLDGRGGRDLVLGGLNDDTVRGSGDGDTLDGGGVNNVLRDRDLLTYQLASSFVSVSLIDGVAIVGGSFLTADSIAKAEVQIFDGTFARLSDISSFEDVRGSNFDDLIVGDNARNLLEGLAGDDTIEGRDGDDTLIGGTGADSLVGEQGIDLVDYSASNAAVNVNLATGLGFGGHAQGDTFATIENIIGSRFIDTLVGDGSDNIIDPGLIIGAGTEVVTGNAGTDTLKINYSGTVHHNDAVTLFLNGGGNGSLSGPGNMTIESMERLNIVTGSGDDSIVSFRLADNDVVNTGDGEDFISVGGGVDYVFAGDDNDAVQRQISEGVIVEAAVGAAAVAPFVIFDPDIEATSFWLDGGRGIDRLSINLAFEDRDVIFLMEDNPTENEDQLYLTSVGGYVRRFEIIELVATGSGNDILLQPGEVNNFFSTGAGNDLLITGLGFDRVDGGENEALPGTRLPVPDVDTLIVDYSELTEGTVFSTFSFDPGTFSDFSQGTINVSLDNQIIFTSVDFSNIERLIVTGTDRDDLITGVQSSRYVGLGDFLIGGAGNDTIGDFSDFASVAPGQGGDDTIDGGEGDDSLGGASGNDLILGGTGTDVVTGGSGNDTIVAGVAGAFDGVETVNAGDGDDLIILGDETGLHYGDFEGETNDAVQILQFGTGGTFGDDRIQLVGEAADYRLQELPFGDFRLTIIYERGETVDDDVAIAVVQSFGSLDLEGDEFVYVDVIEAGEEFFVETVADEGSGLGSSLSTFSALLDTPVTQDLNLTTKLWQAGIISDASLLEALSGPSEPEFFSTEAALLASDFSVTQSATGFDTAIENALAALGLVGVDVDVTLSGDARAFGNFENAFGLDSGFVLSTGQVEDIPGMNLIDGGRSPGPQPETNIPIGFDLIGQFNGSNIFRADLTALTRVGANSITLNDSNSGIGGSNGIFSGFDVDALAFSSTFLASVDASTDLNDASVLPRFDVFDFSPLNTFFNPGTKRPGAPEGTDFAGTVAGFLNNADATLGSFDFGIAGGGGFASLGDGGSMTFNLSSTLGTDGPLYLYVAEAGANDETLDGFLTISPTTFGPAGDLDTDFGVPGAADDTITLTATFDLDLSSVPGGFAFEDLFSLVIVSEELVEFAGTTPEDEISISINGFNGAVLNDGSAATLNNLALGPFGFFNDDLELNLIGEEGAPHMTRADGFTQILTVSGPLIDGLNTIEIELRDTRDGNLDTAVFLATAQPETRVETFRLGDTPTLSRREFATANEFWERDGVTYEHKADYEDDSEDWSAVDLSHFGLVALEEGDLLAGDLGVSGSVLGSPRTHQEIDGTEALRILLEEEAVSMEAQVSRLFDNEGGLGDEAGRVQLFDADGMLVAEGFFVADDDPFQTISLDPADGFVEIVFTAGALDEDGMFVPGALASDSGEAVDDPTDAASSDYLVDWVDVGVEVLVPSLLADLGVMG